jgi:hypothetical protein
LILVVLGNDFNGVEVRIPTVAWFMNDFFFTCCKIISNNDCRDFVFRINTSEDHEALNLKSNGKNKYNIILSIGEDKVTKDAAEALLTILIRTLESGVNALPRGRTNFPCSSSVAIILVCDKNLL